MDLVCRRKWEDIAKGEGKKDREKDLLLLAPQVL